MDFSLDGRFFFFSTTRDFSIFGIFKYRWIFIAFIFVTGFVLFFFFFWSFQNWTIFIFTLPGLRICTRIFFLFSFFSPHIFTYVFPNENDRTSKGHGKVGWFSLCFVETISISIFRINDISNNTTLFLYNA